MQQLTAQQAEQGTQRRGKRRIELQSLIKPAAGLALLALTLWLVSGQTSTESILALGRFWALGIMIPGLILWRLASPFRHNLVEDCAAGALTGAAVLLLAYLAVSPLGLQEWAWLWMAPVLATGLGIPSWRRRVLSRVERPVTPLAAWLIAVACALPLYAIGRHRMLAPEAYTDPRWNHPDMAYQQALAASAKYDVPLQASYVHGEELDYHYFVHQLMAAVSWASGVDLTDLVYTIGWIPLLLAGTALILALADRFAPGSRWAGPLAIALASIGGMTNVYPAVTMPAQSLIAYVWGSPTQNLGSGLTVLLAILVVDLLRGRSATGTWVLAGVIGAAAAGSKATILPLVICGLGLVVLVRLCQRRLARRAILLAVGACGLCLVAVVVVFGRHSTGLSLRPWVTFAKLGVYPVVAWPIDETQVYDHSAMWISAVTFCLGLLLGSAGLLVLVCSPRRWLRDAGMIFVAGVGIAGFAGMVLTDQSGSSQLYFFRTAVPLVAVLAAVGAHMLVFSLRDRRAGLLVAGTVLGGVAAGGLSRAIVRALPADGQPFRRENGTLTGLVEPWLWLLGLLVLVAVVAAVARRRLRAGVAAFLLAAMGAGMFLPVKTMATYQQLELEPLSDQYLLGPSVTQAAAARWLRDNTVPGELIATNAHCAMRNANGCDARHFWIAALSERHVLVEGWAYTNTINDQVVTTGLNPNILPFWDQQRLTENDRAFTSPTRDNLRLLRDRYGVRWLYADPEASAVSPELEALAIPRYRAPDAIVYELR